MVSSSAKLRLTHLLCSDKRCDCIGCLLLIVLVGSLRMACAPTVEAATGLAASAVGAVVASRTHPGAVIVGAAAGPTPAPVPILDPVAFWLLLSYP